MKALIIEKDKLIENINIIKKIANDKKIIAVLKGNGYGLSLVPYAQILQNEGIDFFAVSEISEAVKLRENGFLCSILLLSSINDRDDLTKIIENNIIACVSSLEGAILLNQISKDMDKISEAHIKIDTGFGRYGFLENEIDKIKEINSLSNIKIVGTYSHLSNSFSKKEKDVKIQYDKFIKIIEKLKNMGIKPGLCHIANSHSMLLYPYTQMDAVRVGSAFLGRLIIKNNLSLSKIAYIKSRIDQIKILPKGHFIGYANTYKTKKETKIAIIPVGYKDGFALCKAKDTFRFIDLARDIYNLCMDFIKKTKITVSINGKNATVIGRVSMYNIIADISGIDAKIGDEVILSVNPILVDSEIERKYI